MCLFIRFSSLLYHKKTELLVRPPPPMLLDIDTDSPAPVRSWGIMGVSFVSLEPAGELEGLAMSSSDSVCPTEL